MLRAYPRNDQRTIAVQRPRASKLPLEVDKVQTDNGSEFGASFHWHLLDKGIGHIRIKPRTPRLNGKVERSHRIDSEEFYRLLEGQVIDDARLFNDDSKSGRTTTTTIAPTAPSRGQTPYERLKPESPGPAVIGLQSVSTT